MSSPATATPIAVLVLAWNETSPAVRALVEAADAAAPVVDSVVVVVPAAPGESDELTQEEFLPLSTLPELLPIALPGASQENAPAPAAANPAAPADTQAAAAELPPSAPPLSSPRLASTALPGLPAAAGQLAPTPFAAANAAAPPTYPPLGWETVRVLRLSSFSLPALAERAGRPLPAPIWTGAAAVPVAPYAGASEAASAVTGLPDFIEVSEIQNTTLDGAPELAEAATLMLLPAEQLDPTVAALPLSVPDALPPSYRLAELLTLDPDLGQAELSLLVAAEVEAVELVDELDDFHSEMEQPLAAGFAPEQAGWLDALASLRQPAAAPEAAPVAAASPTQEAAETSFEAAPAYSALLPAAGSFEAPNLNFQVIQYARFAVPVVLAEPPFGVLYAPAWPTWLAAQELRQRTSQPLVLHVATLAAAATESVDTATGWVAELQRQALRRADLILTETPALAQRLRHELHLPAAAVRAVPAADTAAIAQALHTARVRPMASLS